MVPHVALLLLVLSPCTALSVPGARSLATANPLRQLARLSRLSRAKHFVPVLSEEELVSNLEGRDTRLAQARQLAPEQLRRPSPHPWQAADQRPYARTHAIPQIRDQGLHVTIGGRAHELLSGLDHALSGEADVEGRGLFVSFDGLRSSSDHQLSLGKLNCTRLIAAARTKRWWMGPSFGQDASAVPPETQFVLVELGDDSYAVLLPLVEGTMRATLRGSDERKRTQRARAKGRGTGSDAELVAHVQSGDGDTVVSGMEHMLFVATGDDPFELLRRSFRAVSDTLGSFDVSSRKRQPADLDHFGWCTWDAFYQAVDPSGIRAGLASLHAMGTPPRVLIIDDGWQTVVQDGEAVIGKTEAAAAGMSSETDEASARELNKPQEATDTNPVVAGVVELYRTKVDGADVDTTAVRIWRTLANGVLRAPLRRFFAEKTEFSKRLGAFEANAKFEDPDSGISLKGLLRELRSDFGELSVYCWHTLGGYWGGISTETQQMQGLSPTERKPRPTRSLLEVEPALAWDAAALNGCGQGAIGTELQLFHGMHSYLADSGVDGVKIDAQSGLGPFGAGAGGGPDYVRNAVRAMEASVSEHFKGNRCINCMCHSTENLFNYRSTNLLRAADDFYPSEPASQPVHLAHVAYNSLFLGEIGVPDWDMFTSTHQDAGMHAAARAVSGGPLYVSDRPGKHDPELLRKLVLPDGTHLRCSQPGRPTRDTLFTDPNTDGESALKIWNTNAKTGVLATFNVQGSRWDRMTRCFAVDDELSGRSVHTHVRGEDVEALFGRQEPRIMDRGVVVPVQRAKQLSIPLDAVRSSISAGRRKAGEEIVENDRRKDRRPASVLFGQRSRQVVKLAEGEAHAFTLAPRDYELFTVSRVENSGRTSFAPLGLLNMMNGGGAIVDSALTSGPLRPLQARVVLSATDTFGAYCEPCPRQVRLEGQGPVDFHYDKASALLTVELPRDVLEAELVIDFPRQWRAGGAASGAAEATE